MQVIGVILLVSGIIYGVQAKHTPPQFLDIIKEGKGETNNNNENNSNIDYGGIIGIIREDEEIGNERMRKKESCKVGVGIGLAMVVGQVIGMFVFYKAVRIKRNKDSDYLPIVSF